MSEEALAEAPVEPARGERSLAGVVRYFAKLGSWGFGGPIALAGYMHRDLVEKRRWYSEAEYQRGLAVALTMPGPPKGATAAAVGAIAGAAIVIGRQTITGPMAATIAFVALAVLLQKRIKVSEPAVVAAAAGAGLLLHT